VPSRRSSANPGPRTAGTRRTGCAARGVAEVVPLGAPAAATPRRRRGGARRGRRRCRGGLRCSTAAGRRSGRGRVGDRTDGRGHLQSRAVELQRALAPGRPRERCRTRDSRRVNRGAARWTSPRRTTSCDFQQAHVPPASACIAPPPARGARPRSHASAVNSACRAVWFRTAPRHTERRSGRKPRWSRKYAVPPPSSGPGTGAW
jgi:hypothetical protein